MKKLFIFSLPIFLFLLLNWPAKRNNAGPGTIPQTKESKSVNKQVSIDLTEWADRQNEGAAVVVDIEFDHFFKTPKTYKAYPLKDLIAPYIEQLGITEVDDAVVTFYCTDGYKPTQKLKDLLEGDGYLAFRDESVEDTDQNWPEDLQKKFLPFYLVWKNVPYEKDLLNWPYGLFEIEINKEDQTYKTIEPIDNAAAMAGFDAFKHYCIKCHSVNKIGGTMGPDFNYPKNILTYWDKENIWAYAKNPQSFRYNAHMKPVEAITPASFEQIVDYLNYIKDIKPENGN